MKSVKDKLGHNLPRAPAHFCEFGIIRAEIESPTAALPSNFSYSSLLAIALKNRQKLELYLKEIKWKEYLGISLSVMYRNFIRKF